MTYTTDVTLHTYRVTYVTCADEARTARGEMAPKVVEVEAIDAIDAKHLASAIEGEVIATASARKVRTSR